MSKIIAPCCPHPPAVNARSQRITRRMPGTARPWRFPSDQQSAATGYSQQNSAIACSRVVSTAQKWMTSFFFSLQPRVKACTIIAMNANALRLLLGCFLVMIYLVAVLYLRRRKMSARAYAFWGVFALLLPAFGPFFVIAYRPGELVHRKRSRQKFGSKRRSYIRR